MVLIYLCGALGPLLGGQLAKHVPQLLPAGCAWCHGGAQQASFVLFLAANLLQTLLAAALFRESVPKAKCEDRHP